MQNREKSEYCKEASEAFGKSILASINIKSLIDSVKAQRPEKAKGLLDEEYEVQVC